LVEEGAVFEALGFDFDRVGYRERVLERMARCSWSGFCRTKISIDLTKKKQLQTPTDSFPLRS
jgi:hypothetical protein